MTILTKNFAEMKAQIEGHVAADEVVQGKYWENGKGCFIGCLAHGDEPELAENMFGLPVMVQRIAESIFENLDEPDAKAFFAALPDAVECDGKDLTRVGWAFLAEGLAHLPKITDTTQRVIDGMKLLASGQDWPDYHAAADAAADAAAARAADAAAAAARAARAADYATRDRQRDTLLRLIKDAPVVKVPA